MAGTSVNPQLQPTNPQDWTRDSKPVGIDESIRPTGQAPNSILPQGVTTPDRSAEYAGSAAAAQAKQQGMGYQLAGDVVSGVTDTVGLAIKTTDAFIKKDIDRQVYDQSNAERENYTATLESVKQMPGVASLIAGAPEGTGTTPSELEGLGGTLDTMASANSAGKLSNTQYWGKTLQMAKDLRTKYPGYKDYIDNEFSKVLGSNPANAYIQGLVHDINTTATLGAQQQNKVQSYMEQVLKDLPPQYTSAILAKAKRGDFPTPYDVMQYAAPRLQAKANLELQASIASANQTNWEIGKQDYSAARLAEVTSASVQNAMVHLGVDNDAKLADVIQGLASHAYPDEVVQKQIVPQLFQMRMQAQQDLISAASAVDPKGLRDPRDGKYKSIYQANDIGPTNDKITSELKYWDNLIDAFKQGDYHMIPRALDIINARTNDARGRINDHPILGPASTNYTAMQQQFGNDSAIGKAVSTELLTNQNIPQVAKTFVADYLSQIATQTENGKLTLNDVFGTMNMNKAKTPALENPNATKYVLDQTLKGIQNNQYSPEQKAGFIASAFGQGNFNFINQINKDGYTKDGQLVKGQYYTYQQMNSESTIKSMKEYRRSAPDGETAWKNFTQWNDQTFNVLFSGSLGDINKAIQNDKNISIVWDAKNNHFVPQAVGPYDPQSTTQNYLRYVKQQTDFLNLGIDSMARMAKANGAKPEELAPQLLTKLQQFGLGLTSNVRDLPEELATEIKKGEDRLKSNQESGKASRKSIEESIPKLNFAEEDKPNAGLPPEITSGASPVTKKPVFNYSNEQLLGIKTEDIPPDMTAREYHNSILKAREEGLRRRGGQ